MKKFFKKWDSISLIILAVDLLVTVFFSYSLIKLNMLPMLYVILAIALLVVMIIGSAFLIPKKRKKGKKIVGYILSALVIIITGIGSYYLTIAGDFISKSFKETAKDYYTMRYQVLVKQDSNYNDINDLKDNKIGYYSVLPNIEDAKKELEKKISFEGVPYEDIVENFNDLNRNRIAGVLVEKEVYDSLKEGLDTIKDNNYKELYSFELQFEQEITKKEAKGNGFNIYIGGPDFTGTNYDLNMLATVNKDTHKVLLTSIPRDYYVPLAGKGMKDTLTYAGVWGINTSKGTVENIFDIDINYYVKVDTKSLVGVVDAIGGIEFCSDMAFTTTHALVMGTYDDTVGPKLNVVKGCKKYNGIETLTIARERVALPGGDRKRQENCQKIIISIFNKIASAGSLVNLNNILDSISKLYTTNVPQELVQDISKDIIGGNKWSFEQQAVTGSDSRGKVHLGTVEDYVMLPNIPSVDKAKLKIREVMNES